MKKVTLSNLKNLTKEELNNISAIDSILVDDLILSIVNNSDSYKTIENITNNYSKKIKKGIFNYSLAVKGLLPVIENFTKNYYIKYLYPKNTKYTTLVCINDRIVIATKLLNEILQDIKENNSF